MNYRKLRIPVTVLIGVASSVAIYYVYLMAGIMSAIVLAVFVGPPLSLLIRAPEIRYGILGAYAGLLAGYATLVCITLASWGALSEQLNTMITTACYGGGAMAGSVTGVAIALRRKPKAKPTPSEP